MRISDWSSDVCSSDLPDFTDLGFFVVKMIETVQIALWGSVLSIVVGVPCGLLCSNNIAPAWIVQPMRRLMDAARAINELVFAILFVAAVGLGPRSEERRVGKGCVSTS